MLVIDASVAIKWFVEEELADEATALLREATSFYAPDLIIPEVTNVAWRKLVLGQISREQAEKIAQAIHRSPLKIIPSSSLHERALGIAIEVQHSVYDCFYLALAESLGTVVITADRRLGRKLANSTFSSLVCTLEERLARRRAKLAEEPPSK